MKLRQFAATGGVLCACVWTNAHAESNYWDWKSEFQQIVAGGKFNVDARYRFEGVDEDMRMIGGKLVHNGAASTVRTRLGFLSGAYKGFQGMVELEDISTVGDDQYDDRVPGNDYFNKRSSVVDADGTELNQAFLRYSGLPKVTFTGGRQKFSLDNQRFFGSVDWRQNQQTFDGFVGTTTLIPRTTLTYAYLYNANTVFGEVNKSRGDLDMRTHVVNASIKVFPGLTVTPYAYLLEFTNGNKAPNPYTPAASTQTYGVRLMGEQAFRGLKFLYTGEFASQSDYKSGNPKIDSDYYLIEPGLTYRGVTAKFGYEVLGSNDDGSIGFAAPLGTLHIFQGWADIFLTTPKKGIQDLYFSLGANLPGVLDGLKLLATYHDFSADNGNADFGSEFDVQATYSFLKYYTAGVKLASYYAGDNLVDGVSYVDTEKFWAWLEMKF